MLALLLAVAAPDLPSVYRVLQAEVRSAAPQPIDELLEQIRQAPNPTEESKLLDSLASRCGGLDFAEEAKVVSFLSGRTGRSRYALGRCASWLDTSYEEAIRALIDKPDTYALRGLVEAVKRLDRAPLSLADEVVDAGLDALRDATLYQDKVYSALLLYNALSSRSFIRLDADFESVVLVPMENVPAWVQGPHHNADYRWAMMRLLQRGAWRHGNADGELLRHRAREVFRQLGELDPDARLRQLAREWAQARVLNAVPA
jgi:hypothetical protein